MKAAVAYEAPRRARDLRWHKLAGGGLGADGNSRWTIARADRVNRAKGVFKWILTRHGVSGTSGPFVVAKSADDIAELKAFANVEDRKPAPEVVAREARERDTIIPPPTPTMPASGSAGPPVSMHYVTSVQEKLERMGSPDPLGDVRKSAAYLQDCERGGISPEVAAAVILGTLHHGHVAPGPKHAEFALEASRRHSDERDAIIDSAARTLWVDAWAREEEEAGRRLPRGDLMDHAPSTPHSALTATETWAREIERRQGKSLDVLYEEAANAPGKHYRRSTPEDFGYAVMMQALGHGVAWSDDHPDLGWKPPSIEYQVGQESANEAPRRRRAQGPQLTVSHDDASRKAYRQTVALTTFELPRVSQEELHKHGARAPSGRVRIATMYADNGEPRANFFEYPGWGYGEDDGVSMTYWLLPQTAAELSSAFGLVARESANESRLTAARRHALPSREFGIPELEALPLDTKARIRNAPARLEMMHNAGTITEAQYRKAEHRIAAASKAHGIHSMYADESREGSHGRPFAEPREANDGPKACGCKPFTQVVKDPTLYEACRKRADKIGSVTTPRAIYDLVAPDLTSLTHEEFIVLGLGTRGDFEGKVMTYARVAHGDQHEVKVYIEQISQILLADRPDIYIICHNHPGGDATPSEEDEKLTDGIVEGLKKTCPRIVYGDHVIMATSEFYSFREKKKTKIR